MSDEKDPQQELEEMIAAQKTLEEASDKAIATNDRVFGETRNLQHNIYNQTRNDLAPYLQIGGASMGTLSTISLVESVLAWAGESLERPDEATGDGHRIGAEALRREIGRAAERIGSPLRAWGGAVQRERDKRGADA